MVADPRAQNCRGEASIRAAGTTERKENMRHRRIHEQMRRHRQLKSALGGANAGIGLLICCVGIAVIITAGNTATVIFGGLLILCIGIPVVLDSRKTQLGNPPTGRRALMETLNLERNPVCPDCNGWGHIYPSIFLRLWLNPRLCDRCNSTGFLGDIPGDDLLRAGKARFNL